jgi:hypothetical protein
MQKENKKSKKEFVKLYVPELMQLVESGDEKMCLLMAQCEYWFGLYPDGFYKFMSPAIGDIRAYREGDSWTEEMGMSDTKIANALKPICTPYPSYTAYKNEAGDKFKGKFYCSYYHKPSHQTQYLRNHDITNAALKSLSLEERSDIFREKHSSKLGNDKKVISGDTETGCPEIIEAEVVYTENTTKTTPENNSKMTQEREENSHFYPNQIKKEEEYQNVIQKEKEEEIAEYSADAYNVDSSEGFSESGNYTVDENAGWQSRHNVEVPFPSDFELTEDMIGWAKHNKPDIDVHNTTEKFKLYHADKTNKDWLTKWQLWIISEKTTETTYNPSGESSRTVEFRKMYEFLYSPSEKFVNKIEPSKEKTISPEITEIDIPRHDTRAILEVSYQIKPYLMHRDSLYAAYEDSLSKSNYPYSQQTFDEGLKYLCDMKIFQSYFKDYYINLFEYKKSLDWKELTWNEVAGVNVEGSQTIVNFITDHILVLDEVVENRFSDIDVKELELFINGNIKSKLLNAEGHYIYNLEQYKSNPGYQAEVDKKKQELGLTGSQYRLST